MDEGAEETAESEGDDGEDGDEMAFAVRCGGYKFLGYKLPLAVLKLLVEVEAEIVVDEAGRGVMFMGGGKTMLSRTVLLKTPLEGRLPYCC